MVLADTLYRAVRVHSEKDLTKTKLFSCDGLYVHSQKFGYSLYKLYNETTDRFYRYALLPTDANIVWHTMIIGEYHILCQCEGDNTSEFVVLNTKFVNRLYEDRPSDINVYIIQRMLWPDDTDVRRGPTKKAEFELLYRLITSLSDLCVFQQQHKIANYKVDCLFALKINTISNIPEIGLEIDENGHRDRDPKKEQVRSLIIKQFVNRLVRIPIKRTASDNDIDLAAADAEKQIRLIFKDLVVDHSPDIDEKQFLDMVDKYNIDKTFVSMFFRKTEGDPIFRYSHTEIGEFLECSNVENYKHLCNFIKKELHEGEDYKILLDVCASSKIRSHGGHNKKMYMISRLGFYLICARLYKVKARTYCEHFARLYEITLDYCQRLRVRMIQNTPGQKEHKKAQALIKKRIDEVVEQRINKTKVAKVEKELEETRAALEKLRLEHEKLTEEYRTVRVLSNDSHKKYAIQRERNMEFEQYSSMTITKLKSICSEKKYKNYNKLRKSELVTLILNRGIRTEDI